MRGASDSLAPSSTRMTDKIAVTDVTDTALWVAALRAKEAERVDAIFQDPLALMLAGERGEKIARSIAHRALMAWAIVIRTSAIDRLINEAIQMGVDTVINLGAGLDTRPYRMNLPPRIRWIEIDFPKLIDFKNAALVGYSPICKVERIGMNLLERAARQELFRAYGANTGNTLLIAEGVIPYFSNGDAAVLARDLSTIPSFRHWILDFDNAGSRSMPKGWAKHLRAAPFLFQVGDWFHFFEECAWHPHKVITSAEESERLERPYPFTFPQGLVMRTLPREVSRRILSVSGAVLLRQREELRPEA